jgi:hypothetical protein
MSLIKYIFTTNIYDDTDKMPNKNKMVLSISSLWILNLLSHSYLNNYYILTFIITSISIISPLFWYNYKINSIYHKLDKNIVISMFIYLLSQTNYYLYYHIYKILSLVSIILLFYLISAKSCINNNYELQLYSHLTFRYFTFLLLYYYIMNNNDNDNNYMTLITIEYILFNYYLMKKIKDNKINKFLLYNLIIIISNEYLYYYIIL